MRTWCPPSATTTRRPWGSRKTSSSPLPVVVPWGCVPFFLFLVLVPRAFRPRAGEEGQVRQTPPRPVLARSHATYSYVTELCYGWREREREREKGGKKASGALPDDVPSMRGVEGTRRRRASGRPLLRSLPRFRLDPLTARCRRYVTPRAREKEGLPSGNLGER